MNSLPRRSAGSANEIQGWVALPNTFEIAGSLLEHGDDLWTLAPRNEQLPPISIAQCERRLHKLGDSTSTGSPFPFEPLLRVGSAKS